MDKSEKRLLIEEKQRQLRTASLTTKIMQFDIKILELEEEIDRLRKEKDNCQQAIDKIMEE